MDKLAHDGGLISRRSQDKLFLIQIVLNIIVLGALLGLMLISTIRISDINRRQIEAVKQQNDAQLCAQHDITVAVRKIGLKLGLPVEDIVPPDVSAIQCPKAIGEGT